MLSFSIKIGRKILNTVMSAKRNIGKQITLRRIIKKSEVVDINCELFLKVVHMMIGGGLKAPKIQYFPKKNIGKDVVSALFDGLVFKDGAMLTTPPES